MKHRFPIRTLSLLTALILAATIIGCLSHHYPAPGTPAPRAGDEISVCGQFFHTGTRIVLWTDPHGYDAYRVYKRFGPFPLASWEATTNPAAYADDAGITNPSTLPSPAPSDWSPQRYSYRNKDMTPAESEHIRGGWQLPELQKKIDQFVIHYDDCGTSQICFRVLQDQRNLSVHFMLDLDGTIYQTLDLQERARHATISNNRSIGIEIANMGSYGSDESIAPLKQWYHRDAEGKIRLTIPAHYGDGGILTPHFIGYPARQQLIVGRIQGRMQKQYDYTPQQYQALIHLTATLCKVFPLIKCDAPREANGSVVNHALSQEQWENYRGILGHYHVQTNKSDPGPAFQWDYVIHGARNLMNNAESDRKD